ncbi:uncharacterized protein LOC132892416 [Neoarius graeffei]|uniref:uncharacterized protein LOC132892416 n=1 Tax=Neoarius graeffei TaxID=443677 RepID=UPI00298C4299|nr:uncharacterized protein LOC132892416 [Neoarius graeffei]
MEVVKNVITRAMPVLTTDVIEELMDHLKHIGVNSIDDMQYLTSEDLDGILPPIQRRRLIQAFTADLQAVLGSTSLQPNVHLPENPPLTPGPMEESSSRETVVPWHKMPPNLMLALREKKRPKPKERREMIRIVIDDVLAKERGRPGRGKLREIAKKIVQQYPSSFQDREMNGTTVIGTGYDSVFIQLENRLENISRPCTFNSRPAAERGDEIRKKSSHSDRYGCVEWQPAVENTPELESKKDNLKNDFKTRQLEESVVRKLMTDTYSIQRTAINNGSTVKTLMEEWPFLFEAACMFDHTHTLLGLEVQTKLAEEVSRKGKGIKDFLQSRGIKMAPSNNLVQLISGIAKFFREKPEQLFHPSEESAAAALPLQSTPCILTMGDHHYKIAVDQEVVNNHISSMIVALSYTFAAFYVFNIKYPKDMALTLEFIQRVFLGINPERGSKAEKKGKKHPHLPPRLLKFLCELNSFENPWIEM